MIIQLDTATKQITVQGHVSLKELVDWLMNFFPDFEYEEWTLGPSTQYVDTATPHWWSTNQPGVMTTGSTIQGHGLQQPSTGTSYQIGDLIGKYGKIV